MTPTVSVIMAARNAGLFIEEAIDSIISQTLRNFELLIIDDASTDNSASIVKSYRDKRIVLLENSTNLGVADSRNIGISQARGDLIAIMDADDISLPDRFETQVRYLSQNPNILACGSWYKKLFENGDLEKIHTETNSHRLSFLNLFYCPFPNSSAMIRKSVFNNIGKYNREYEPAEDFDLWSRIGTESLAIIPEYLLVYRVHSNSLSKKSDRSAAVEIARRNLQPYGISETHKVVILKYGSTSFFRRINRLISAFRTQYSFAKHNKYSIRESISLLPILKLFF